MDKTKRLTLIIVLTLLVPYVLLGKDSGFWDKFHLRHNLELKREVAQPAIFQITIPDEEKAKLRVGMGLIYDLIDSNKAELGIFVDYQKNTSADKEQDVIKIGTNMEWQIFDLTKTSTNSPVILSKFNYKNDVIKKAKSIQASVAYTHISRGGLGFWPNTTIALSDFLKFTYSPLLGFEYENIISADDESKKGNIIRGNFQCAMSVFPNASKWRERLELTISYTYKKDFMDSTNEDIDNHSLFKAGINLYFIKKGDRLAGIGFSYINGEDPSTGFQKQELIEISFIAIF